MSPHLKKASEYLLEHPEAVAVDSMRTIAKHAGVHPTTMVRLARELSFSGYNELRAIYQNRVKQKKVPHLEQARALLKDQKRADSRGIINRSQVDAINALNTTYESLDPALLEAVAKLILSSNHFFLSGFGSNYTVAAQLYYQALLITPDASLVSTRSSFHCPTLRYIKKGDVLLAVSTEPYSKTCSDIAKYAHKQGAVVIAISDSVVGPVSTLAKYVLSIPNFDEAGYDYLLPATAVGNLIMSEVIRIGGKKSLTRLECSDKHAEEFFHFD